jgi:hypothetical protein
MPPSPQFEAGGQMAAPPRKRGPNSDNCLTEPLPRLGSTLFGDHDLQCPALGVDLSCGFDIPRTGLSSVPRVSVLVGSESPLEVIFYSSVMSRKRPGFDT